MSTVFGWPLVALPGTPAAPASIDWNAMDTVALSLSPFTGQQQTQNWQGSWLEGSVHYPPMAHAAAQAWIAFLLGVQGMGGVFQLGDPLSAAPRGTAAGTILVNGANQAGYTLAIDGGTGSNCLLPGDYIQIGYRLYRNLSTYNGGAATINIWPNLRESPADDAAVVTTSTKGLFRLKANQRGWSINGARHYGISFEIREAI